MRNSKRTRFASIFLSLLMVVNLFPFTASAVETESDGGDAAELASVNGHTSAESTENADKVSAVDSENADKASSESTSVPVASYTVSIALPEQGVALANGQSKQLLAQTVSAGSAMQSIRLVSTYADEPFDESIAGAFNSRLFAGTGLTAKCDANGVITISGTPTANVAVNLADAFAEDAPAEVADNTAVYVATATATDSYTSSLGNDSTGDGTKEKPYATISKAYTEVADGGTIYIVGTLTVAGGNDNVMKFSSKKAVTITSADSSNKSTITSSVNTTGTIGNALFDVSGGCDITFTNIILDGTNQTYIKANNSGVGRAYCAAVYVSNGVATIGSGVTIQNFNYGANCRGTGDSKYGGQAVLYANSGSARINILDGALITNCKIEGGNPGNPAAVVLCGSGGTVSMTGGEVKGNSLQTDDTSSVGPYNAVMCAGKVNNPHFWMTGGVVTGNTINYGGAAVYMRGEASQCDIQFGDTAYVYGNYVSGTSGEQRNIYLKNNNSGSENSNVYAKLCSALTGNAKLGVYAELIGMGTKVAQGGGINGGSYTATAADATRFVSDKATDAEILYCGGSSGTCGLLQHRSDDTDHNNKVEAIYLSISPTVTATKNTINSDQIDLSVARCTSDATYVVLDKDLKPVTGKTLSGGTYETDGNGTFKLTDSATATTISMPGLDKANGPYTVMLVGSDGLTVGTDGKADTSKLTDIATVNIVNFAGDGVKWSDGTNSFENGDFDIVTVPHNDQTGKANKTYTATTKTNYSFVETDAISGKLDNSESTALTVDATKDESAEKYKASVTVPAYGTTEKGTTNYNTVTLTGATSISTGVKLLDKTDGTVMTDGKTYDGVSVAHTAGSVDGATLSYTWQKKNADNDGYTNIADNAAPSDAGDYNLKITATSSSDSSKVLGTEDLPFTISKKLLTVNATAQDKTYDGKTDATVDATLDTTNVVSGDDVTLNTTGVTASFKDENVGENKTVTLTGSYTLSGAAAKNYTVAQPTGLTANITAAPLTITGATVTDKTYDGKNDAAITAVTFDGLKNGETLTANTDYTVSDARYDHVNATGDDAATKVGFKVTLVNTGLAKNYTLVSDAGSQIATIGKASHDNDTLSTEGYRGETNTSSDLSVHVVEGGTVGDSVTVNDANGILDGTPTYDSATGKLSYTLKSTATDGQTATVTLPVTSANYSDYSIVVTVGVTPKETAEIGITSRDYEYNGTAQAPTDITVTGDKVPVDALEITYKGADGTTYPESATAPANAGKYVMTAKVKDGNTRYTGSATCTFEITKKPLTVTATAEDKTYDGGTTATLQGATLDGVLDADKSAVSLDNDKVTVEFTDKNAGDSKAVTASVADGALTGTKSGNYTIKTATAANAKISPKTVTATITAENKTYDGSETATVSTPTLTDVISGDKVTATASNAKFVDGPGVGDSKDVTADIALTGDDAGNYTLTSNTASTTANITAKELTVTATAENKVYDGKTDAKATVTLTESDIVQGDTVTMDSSSMKATFDAADVGNGRTVTVTGLKLTGASADNYKLPDSITATASITQADGSGSVELKDWTYGDTANAPKPTSETNGTDNVAYQYRAKDAAESDPWQSTAPTDAGTYTVKAIFPANTNYGETTATANFTISKKELTATIKADDKTYDGNSTAKVTAALTGVVDGDSGKVTAVVTNPAFEDKNADVNKKVTAAIALDGTAAGNYFVNAEASTTANITAREVSISDVAIETSKVYDGNAEAKITNNGTLTGVLDGDTVTIKSGKATYNDKTVAESKAVTFSDFGLEGEDAGNYMLKGQPADTSAAITKREVTISGLSATKTYDGDNTAEKSEITGTPAIDNKALDTDDVSLNTESMTGTFDSADAGKATTVTLSGISLTGKDAGNYKLPETVTCEGTITKASGSGSVKLDGWTYGEAANNPVPVSDTNGTASVTYQYKGKDADDKTYSDTVPTKAGNYTVKATFAATNNYTAATATADFTIAKKTLTVTATAENKVYDGSTKATVTNVVLSGKVGDDTVSLNEKGMSAAFADANVGTGKTVTVSGLTLDNNENGNYKLPDSITAKASITQAAGSGTVKLDGWTYGDTAKSPNVSSSTNPGSESSPITYQYKAKDAADDAYTATIPTDAGTYTVKATFPENDNYAEATATAEFTIGPKTLTVNVAAQDKVYDGTKTASLNDAALDGIVEADANSATLETSGVSAAFNDKNVGTGKSVTLSGSYTLSGDAAKNYTVAQPTGLKANITAAPLTIKGATVTAKTYDGKDGATVTGVTFDGLKNGETLALSTDYTVYDAKYDGVNATGNASATKVDFKVTLADTDLAKNYTLPSNAGSQSATIGKASHDGMELTTKGNRGESNTLDGVSSYVVTGGTVGTVVTAGEDIFTETPTYDSATGKLTYKLKSTAAESQTATVTLPVTSANYSDYNIVVTVGVTPKETVVIGITAGTYEYNGTAQAPTGITVSDNKVPVNTLEITYEGTEGTVYEKSSAAPTNAGKYVMTVKVPDGNTKYTGSATCSFEITKKALTATITAEDKTYDGNATATVTPSLEGVVGSDAVTANVTNPVFADKSVGEGKKVTASVGLSGDATGNYTVNATAETTASISAKEVSITGVTVANSKIYDRSASATPVMTNAKIDGKVETDNLAITAGTASYDNANVGTNKTVSFTGFGLEGDDVSNYKLKEQPASTTANIIAKEVSISGTAVDATKVYDGTADAKITNNGELTGVLTGDTVTVKAGTAAYNDKTAGKSKAVKFSDFGLQGKDSGNYTLKEQPADTSAAIAQREVTISGLSATKTYDGDNTAAKSEITGAPVVGNKAVEGDDVSLNTDGMAGTFNSKNVDEATTVTLSGISLTGNDATNYKLPASVACAGKIIKADGNGTVTLAGWTYGSEANAPQPTSNTNGTDKVAYRYKLKDADDTAYTTTVPTNAGEYTVEAAFAATNNYNETTATADFTISPKELTVNVAAADKEYDGTTNATLNDATLDGVVGTDKGKVKLETSGVSAAFNDKNIGTGKPITLTGSYTLSGDAAKNYTVAQPKGLTASISAREVSITGVTVEAGKTYDKSAAAKITNNGTIDGKVEADSLSITVGTANYDDANVGTNKAVTFTGFGLEGTDASNYKLKEQPASTTANITAKEVTASITAKSKVFDGTTAAEATSTLTGAVAGDVVFAKITGAEFADANVADGKQVTAAIELAGDAAANYSANKTATANANITAKALTLTIKANDKKLDGSDAAVLDTENATLDGMVSGHLVSVGSAKGAFENCNTASDAASVNVTDVKLEGEDAGNYEITKINSVTAKLIPLYVTFVDGDAKLDEKTISVYGTAPTDVVSPEKSGYNFAGWYTDEGCTAPWNSKAGVTADTTVYAKWSTDALYTLSGVVKQGEAAKSDVAVTLYEGSVGIATATTDANGMYSFGNVPNGIYTITAKASDRAATTAVTVQDGDITQDIVLPAIAVAAEVQVEPGAPAATVSGIDEALVNALIASDGNNVTAPKDGERLEVKLNVKADASDPEKAAIQKKENENTKWDFVNMDVDWSKYDHLETNIGSGNIADTVNVLAIRVPYDRNDKRDIVVYRHHMNGDAVEVTQFTQLQSEPEEAKYTDGECYVGDDYIMLYTQKFSAFGIGYIADATDPKIEGAEDGKTYCGPVTLTITDEEIAQVTVNGKEVSLDADGQLTLNPADGEQTVVAVDAARNSSSITVTVNNGHTWGTWASNGNGTHTRTCKVDATHSETTDCHGGTATCVDRAVCDDCGHAYGEVDPGNHAALTHVDAKAATTAAEGNIEYWHCEDCGKYFADAAGTKEIQQTDTVVAKKAASSDSDKGDSADGKTDGSGSGKSKVSRTGDSTAAAWPFAILGTAAVAAAIVSARRRRS